MTCYLVSGPYRAVGGVVRHRATQGEGIKMKLSRLIDQDNVRAVSVYGASTVPDGIEDMDPWTVMLKRKGRQLTVPFFTGYGLRDSMADGPDAGSVLSALLSDSYAESVSFETFCDDFGYDTDSRKAEATYNACKASAAKLRKFLGSDFAAYQAAENDI